MPKPKVPKEIRDAKSAIEQEISETLHIITRQFHEKYPTWIITDMDIGIIEFPIGGRMTAASRVELTSNDLEMKICKGNQVKEVK